MCATTRSKECPPPKSTRFSPISSGLFRVWRRYSRRRYGEAVSCHSARERFGRGLRFGAPHHTEPGGNKVRLAWVERHANACDFRHVVDGVQRQATGRSGGASAFGQSEFASCAGTDAASAIRIVVR